MPAQAEGAAVAEVIASGPAHDSSNFRRHEYMKQSQNDQVSKKFYEPPKIVTINLRPEEAVLGNCKISGSSGPGNPSCAIVPRCSTVGS
jgi:hypothetical protein